MPRPSVLPLFAISGTLRVRPVAFEADGYPGGYIPPAENHNWQFGVIGDWLQYLDERATPFASLADFIDGTAPGEYGYVWRPYGQEGKLELEETLAGFSSIDAMVCDGRYLFVATDDADVVALDANDLTTTVYTYTLTEAVTGIDRLACNGAYVLVSYVTASNRVFELFTVAGVSQGTVTVALGGAEAIAMDGDAAYIVNGNTVEQRRLVTFTSLQNSYDHSAAVSTIFIHGQLLVVHGSARVSDDLPAAIGDTLVGVLPAGAGMTPLWGTTRSLAVVGNTCKSDGRIIYAKNTTILQTTNYANGIQNRADATILETTGVGTNDGFSVDDEYIYALSNGVLYTYDKRDLACLAWTSVSATELSGARLCTDGDQVFVGTNDTVGPSATIHRFSKRTGAPRLFGRQDPEDDGKTIHSLLAVAPNQ